MGEKGAVINPSLELWAGIECTVNRVGDEYLDQIARSGHPTRAGDLELFADLGIRAFRYPLLWERIAPEETADPDWKTADHGLARLRELGIRPIAGLVHHGSGPRYTSLIDPDFPSKLARYARAVAERYPWVESYTPVNEPLTTARFSGLYGHWYPHARDESIFARAMLTQARAIVLSMREIRKVNSQAQLVQTEDLGKTFSTRTLSYQAEFENERRWLTFDLLTGRVDRAHPMWEYLIEAAGVPQAELEWFLENFCEPEIAGINHYLTSERFLDERVKRYPEWTHGGNDYHVYADVEAVRVLAQGAAGPRALLFEAWERFHLPLAVTELHLGCTREEQLRWIKEVWEGAGSLQQRGVDIRAVTAWSLLGAYDWDNLLTSPEGNYESGVFDLRGTAPRPTAIARMLKDLAAGREYSHPVLDTPGWWRRNERLLYPPVGPSSTSLLQIMPDNSSIKSVSAPLIISGATGTLGRAFARICESRGLSYCLLSRADMDISDPQSVERVMNEYQPWALINASGYVRVDDAEGDAERCYRENTHGAMNLAAACDRHNASLLTFSTDLVFCGSKQTPYVESDPTSPLNIYGKSKAQAEQHLLHAHPAALIVRTSAFFGPWDEYNFVTIALRTLLRGRPFLAADDAWVSATYVPDLVNASLDLLIDGESGIWNLSNPGPTTWADLARLAATSSGFDASMIETCPTSLMGFRAPRPLYSVLGSERGLLLPSLESALSRYLVECETLPLDSNIVSIAS